MNTRLVVRPKFMQRINVREHSRQEKEKRNLLNEDENTRKRGSWPSDDILTICAVSVDELGGAPRIRSLGYLSWATWSSSRAAVTFRSRLADWQTGLALVPWSRL